MSQLKNIPLRERKFAQTKLSILNVFLDKVENEPMDEISVKELCAEAEVSYQTFFNYFESKSDLLVYFASLWSIEVNYEAEKFQKKHNNLETIEHIFKFIAKNFKTKSVLIGEFIAFLAQRSDHLEFHELTEAEYLIHFADKPDNIRKTIPKNLPALIQPFVVAAIKDGEISKKADSELLTVMIATILFGTPIINLKTNAKNIDKLLLAQLSLVWQAVKA
jgi:AcrR family transcriptional regulator